MWGVRHARRAAGVRKSEEVREEIGRRGKDAEENGTGGEEAVIPRPLRKTRLR